MPGFRNSAAHFSRALKKFGVLSKRREQLLFVNVIKHVHRSIVHGSEVTGSPGQPFKTGDLQGSYIRTGSIENRLVTIASDLGYAPYYEDPPQRRIKLRSAVGGFHSVKITRLNFRWLVRYELILVKGATR